MLVRSLLLLSLVVVCLSGCHRSNTPDDGWMDGGVDGDTGDTERRGRRDTEPSDTDPDIFVDPGCDAGPPIDTGPAMRECEPFMPMSCGPGRACFSSAIPPRGGCGEEVYVTYCRAAGSGRQGDSCLNHVDCSAGFACFVTGAGTQCAATCDPAGGEPACPRGFLCRSTDVPGYGACI